MSQHQAFRRAPVQQQAATKQETVTFPAPTRGLILNENESYMQPGAALIMDNWKPTMKGAAIRGGHILWADLYGSAASAFTPATFDPATASLVTLSGGNLVATNTGGSVNNQGARVAAAGGKSSGKYYFEMTFTNLANTGFNINTCVGITMAGSTYAQVCQTGALAAVVYQLGSVSINAMSPAFASFPQFASGDVVGVAVDLDASPRRIWFRKGAAGLWNNSGASNPSTPSTGADISVLTGPLVPICGFNGASGINGNITTANFGGTAFVGAAPSGFTPGWGTPVAIGSTAAWDPTTAASVTLSGGNLVSSNTSNAAVSVGVRVATAMGKTTGKYYFEQTMTTVTGGLGADAGVGVGTVTSTIAGIAGNATAGALTYYQSGATYANGVITGFSMGAGAAGQTIGVAVDLDNRKVWFRKGAAGLWNNTVGADPATNVGGVTLVAGTIVPWQTFGNGGTTGHVMTTNFGASVFVGAAPSGFLAGWGEVSDASRAPIISSFTYATGATNRRMYFATTTTIYDVTTTTPVVIKSGQANGNYSSSQMANAAGDHLIVVNDAGDFPLRFDGASWTTLNADQITGPPGSAVEHGRNLVHVCKYRNRWFFIELNSMNAWYLGLNSIGGALLQIPLSGAATKGGKLLYCATWSIDAGDGIDDKIVFGTDLGEIIVFTGSDPSNAAAWRQEGRYDMSPPMGKNATLSIGGDLLVACVDGILPTSGAITKDKAELELAAVTRAIKPMWRQEVLDKRSWAWTMCKWDPYGGVFVTWPGGPPGEYRCAVVNAATGAWCRYTGWDATCFAKMNDDMFFGTQTGRVMQADRTGTDNGAPYVCTMVGGWEVFQSPSQTITWKQARASFSARPDEQFIPQLSGTTDYVITLPTPPMAAADSAGLDLWDSGRWDSARWDSGTPPPASVRNTGWVSIGVTGFSHAPIIQVTMSQQDRPDVEFISTAGVFERLAVTV
jgi:hypothetical protein